MKRSKFNLSNTKLLSCDMGELVPCGLTEVLPGDTIRCSTSALIRAAPLLSPVMHPVDVRIHHWFVPHRLVWDNWENFITGGPDGLNASVFPTITINPTVGTLADYLGVPPGTSIAVSALPFRGYARIWNDWYRDQDLQTALVVSKADGVDATTNTTLQNVCWERDYFTSSRPWEQKGAQVTVPIGTTAPVLGIGYTPAISGAAVGGTVYSQTNGAAITGNVLTGGALSTTHLGLKVLNTGAAGPANPPQIFADLQNASGVTVNVLRQALAVQRFQEARARYGSRYVEYLAALGVRSSDARLDRPEYLGGGRQRIQFSEVLATAETGTSVDVGDLKGHGIAAMRSNRFQCFIEEHGYIHSFISVKPKTIYASGLFRHWNRRTKLDYWQKELEHIGQQPVLNKEVYTAHASPDATFGYQDRYDEYRRSESSIAGEFRSTVLDYWHMARIFSSSPALNSTFVSSVPTERVFAAPANDVLYIHARHNMQARRLVASSGNSFIY